MRLLHVQIERSTRTGGWIICKWLGSEIMISNCMFIQNGHAYICDKNAIIYISDLLQMDTIRTVHSVNHFLRQLYSLQDFDVQKIVDQNGEPWWIAKDACDVLGLVVGDSVRYSDEDEKSYVSREHVGGIPQIS